MERVNDILPRSAHGAHVAINWSPQQAATLIASPTTIPNVLQDFNFETGVEGWSAGGTAAVKAVAASSSWSSRGNSSLHVTGNNFLVGDTHLAGGPDMAAVLVGSSYTASCDINVVTPCSTGVRLRIDWYANVFTYLSSSAASYATSPGVVSQAVTGTAPATATLGYVVVSNEGDGTGAFYVDNIRFAVNESVSIDVMRTPIGVPVTFTGSVTFFDDGRTAAEWYWDLGDGSTALGQVATHTYHVANPHAGVGLVVTDDIGHRHTCRVQIYLVRINLANMMRDIVAVKT